MCIIVVLHWLNLHIICLLSGYDINQGMPAALLRSSAFSGLSLNQSSLGSLTQIFFVPKNCQSQRQYMISQGTWEKASGGIYCFTNILVSFCPFNKITLNRCLAKYVGSHEFPKINFMYKCQRRLLKPKSQKLS